MKENRIHLTWRNMINRCYNEKRLKTKDTYKECEVCDLWLDYYNFEDWYKHNYYKVNNEQMCLDKDILIKGNKIYSPDTCIFVPQGINKIFTKCNKKRGSYPLGVSYDKNSNKYRSQIKYTLINGKTITKYLGSYNDIVQAFNVYKKYKELYIKQVADKYKQYIPDKLYIALYNYNVDIND